MDPSDDRPRLPLALVLACPACAGGFVLALGAVLGATALAVKGALLAAGAVLIGGLWLRNAWNRRGEP